MPEERVVFNRDVSLVELLDRVIHKGVVVEGDVTLSVAEVDLIYVGLKLVLCSVDRVQPPSQLRAQPGSYQPPQPKPPVLGVSAASSAAPQLDAQTASPQPADEGPASDPIVQTAALKPLATPGPEAVSGSERGLAQLVLTLVELLRELMERQAVRRMDNDTLTDAEIERMGECFLQISARMEELKTLFELTDADLNLDLGPLGNLLDK
ncbi:MAG: hypothetical protein GYB67_12090 [Chloroflexi bacterium]|nr:hypothetical protein [Chloroflexota bacterium]